MLGVVSSNVICRAVGAGPSACVARMRACRRHLLLRGLSRHELRTDVKLTAVSSQFCRILVIRGREENLSSSMVHFPVIALVQSSINEDLYTAFGGAWSGLGTRSPSRSRPAQKSIDPAAVTKSDVLPNGLIG